MLSDLEVASDCLGSVESLSLRWLLPSEERVGRRDGEVKREGGENFPSSPHASLNRPTRLVAESHQSLGKRMKKRET